MIELFPAGEFPIMKIDENWIYFEYQSSIIQIPSALIGLNNCVKCKHFRSDIKNANTCDAFQKGIPNKIFQGFNNHIMPYPGDHGIQFEPLEPEKKREEDERRA